MVAGVYYCKLKLWVQVMLPVNMATFEKEKKKETLPLEKERNL